MRSVSFRDIFMISDFFYTCKKKYSKFPLLTQIICFFRSSESSLDKAELTHLIGCSIADSASDDLIKNKIQEANLLIERVKLALDKIKAIKTGDTQVKSSSTENEDLKNEESVAEAVPSKELKEDIKVSKQVCGPGSFKKVCHAKTRVNRLERPKTRRNEADDEMTEDVARNKFRNVPEDRHLNENVSLVELQTKLQTISETTESDHSIPRTPSLLLKIDKEVQATPSVITVGVSSNYSRENKQVQTSPLHNSKEVIVQTDDLPIKVVKPPVKRCEIECLPILEVLPEPEACVCQKCKTVLNKENLTGLSICSKPQKLQKLAVQVLPPVVIPESMTLTPVLHLSISPNGHTENHVKNSKNVAFVSNYYDPEPKAHIEFLDERSIKEIPQDEEGEEQKKMLVCKSYQIYDNPNKHDPGELDKQSLAKVSHLDVDFYRTFINPDPVMSEPRLGFVSKSTQCDWGDLDQESLNPHLPHKKINFSLHGNDVDNTSIVGGRSITSNIESTVTVLRLNPNLTDDDEDILNPYASKFVLHGSYEGKSQDDSSPSAITVTMSYSLSSDENTSLNKESKSNKSSANEVQLKVTNFEKDERTLTAKDTTMIKQIREKLQSLDATGGEKPYYQFLNSSFDLSKKADLHLKDPTVNYVLGGSSAKHLELGPNGRYKDEEHLFSQTAHPKTTFEHRDVEMAGDKLFKLPPRLRRLDTSNSDTITTNSQLSEGELLCKHSVSNGELHQCHYRPFKTRNILTKSSRVLRKRPSRKIDFRDPSVSVELRRNYFNNWVTYYVKPQDVYESTISGSNSSTVQ